MPPSNARRGSGFPLCWLRRVAGIYWRILVHDNQHMSQLIANARMSGVKPPDRRSKAN